MLLSVYIIRAIERMWWRGPTDEGPARTEAKA